MNDKLDQAPWIGEIRRQSELLRSMDRKRDWLAAIAIVGMVFFALVGYAMRGMAVRPCPKCQACPEPTREPSDGFHQYNQCIGELSDDRLALSKLRLLYKNDTEALTKNCDPATRSAERAEIQMLRAELCEHAPLHRECAEVP